MKKKFLVVIPLIVIILIIFYFKEYSIRNTKSDILYGTKKFMKATRDIKVLKSLKLDNKLYVLMTNSDRMFLVEFERGLNNRFKINSITYCFEDIRAEIIKINNKKFLICYGKLNNPDIDYVTTYIINKTYKLKFENKPFVIAYCKIEDMVDIGDTPKFYNFFDKNNNRININHF